MSFAFGEFNIVGVEGNVGRINAAGQQIVEVGVPMPPPIVVLATSDMSGTLDLFRTVTNGTVLTIQNLVAGAETGNGGSIVELFEDATGTGTPLNLIMNLYINEASDSVPLNRDFVGDGTRRILLRRRAFGGGSREITAEWVGTEV